jgi:type II secretory pathway component PulJ
MRYCKVLIREKQSGFILINVILSLALIGILGIGVTATILQVFDESAHAGTNTQVVQQVENVGYWIGHDCLMAQGLATSNSSGSGFPLVLTWITWGDDVIKVIYTLTDGKLQRNMTINAGQPRNSQVAEYIDMDPLKTNCHFDDDVLTFKVTATVDSTSKTRTYQVRIRPESTS